MMTSTLLSILWLVCALYHNSLAHIGEPCNSILDLCLPPSQHVYCDKDHICRCEEAYPVIIGPHSCKRAKRVGERCSHQLECTHSDPNAYCTQTPYASECQCHHGFTFSYSKNICVPDARSGNHTRKGFEQFVLPSTLGLLFASLGCLCCVIFVWQHFCTRPPQEPLPNQSWARRAADARSLPEYSPGSPHSEQQTRLTLGDRSSPPPPYEEAIKFNCQTNTLSSVIVDPKTTLPT